MSRRKAAISAKDHGSRGKVMGFARAQSILGPLRQSCAPGGAMSNPITVQPIPLRPGDAPTSRAPSSGAATSVPDGAPKSTGTVPQGPFAGKSPRLTGISVTVHQTLTLLRTVQGTKPAVSDMRQKSDLLKRFKLICSVQSLRNKYIPSLSAQITGLSHAIPSRERGVGHRHERWDGMRWTRQRRRATRSQGGFRSVSDRPA
jgi:hypothetical protein